MGVTRSTPRGTYCGSCPARGCKYGTPSIWAGKRRACPARTPLLPTVYPTPCGEQPEYLATAQVHLYGACTNGPPVHQSYTLTGSASIGPSKGKNQGMRPEPALSPPPPPKRNPPHTHYSPGSPGADTRGAARKATQQRGRGGRARKGTGERTTTTGPKPGVAGNHTQAPQPGLARDCNTQPPHPHRAASPSPERRGQATKHTTNTPHTHPRTHNTHHHHHHSRHQHKRHKHTKHMKARTPPAPRTHTTQETRTPTPKETNNPQPGMARNPPPTPMTNPTKD